MSPGREPSGHENARQLVPAPGAKSLNGGDKLHFAAKVNPQRQRAPSPRDISMKAARSRAEISIPRLQEQLLCGLVL
jgi:hypothetical protein